MSEAAEPRMDRIGSQMRLRSRVHRVFESAVIFTLVDLKLFHALAQRPLTLKELSLHLGLPENRLARVLRAGVGFELLTQDSDGRYQIPTDLEPFLAPDSPDTLLPWIEFIHSISPGLLQAGESVHHPEVSEDDSHFCLRGADLDAFSRAMHLYACGVGSELPNFLDLSGCRSLLDLGCGSGTYAFLLGREYPELSITLTDEERVLEVARHTARQFALENPVRYHSSDILNDPIPAGHDVILISNLLHLIGPTAARELVRRCFQAVEPGGLLAVQAQFLKEGDGSRGWPVMLDWILLACSPRGRNHSVAETVGWLEEAGFQEVAHRPMSLVNANSLVVGRKAASPRV